MQKGFGDSGRDQNGTQPPQDPRGAPKNKNTEAFVNKDQRCIHLPA